MHCLAQGHEGRILRALQMYMRDEYKDKRGAAVDTKEWRTRSNLSCFPCSKACNKNTCALLRSRVQTLRGTCNEPICQVFGIWQMPGDCVALQIDQTGEHHPLMCRCSQDAPQQQNGCDCGVFVLVSAEHLARGAPLTFCQEEREPNALLSSKDCC